MKHLKMVGLAAIAALGLMALVGAGMASAEVLCKTRGKSCPVGWDLKAGDRVESSLRGSSVMETTSNTVLETCTAGTWKWEVQDTGGPGRRVDWTNFQVVRSNCTSSVSTIRLGTDEVENIAGTENGTVFEKESETTFLTFGVSCTYGTGTSGTDIGVIEAESEETTVQVNAVLNKVSGSLLCPSTIKWTELWESTNPRGIRVLP